MIERKKKGVPLRFLPTRLEMFLYHFETHSSSPRKTTGWTKHQFSKRNVFIYYLERTLIGLTQITNRYSINLGSEDCETQKI